MTPPLVRINAFGEWEHLTHDGWIRVDHGSAPSLSIAPGSGLALQEPLELPPDVSQDLTRRDAMSPEGRVALAAILRTATALLPVVPAHASLHDEPKLARPISPGREK